MPSGISLLPPSVCVISSCTFLPTSGSSNLAAFFHAFCLPSVGLMCCWGKRTTCMGGVCIHRPRRLLSRVSVSSQHRNTGCRFPLFASDRWHFRARVERYRRTGARLLPQAPVLGSCCTLDTALLLPFSPWAMHACCSLPAHLRDGAGHSVHSLGGAVNARLPCKLPAAALTLFMGGRRAKDGRPFGLSSGLPSPDCFACMRLQKVWRMDGAGTAAFYYVRCYTRQVFRYRPLLTALFCKTSVWWGFNAMRCLLLSSCLACTLFYGFSCNDCCNDLLHLLADFWCCCYIHCTWHFCLPSSHLTLSACCSPHRTASACLYHHWAPCLPVLYFYHLQAWGGLDAAAGRASAHIRICFLQSGAACTFMPALLSLHTA